jgi:hypothetical protein
MTGIKQERKKSLSDKLRGTNVVFTLANDVPKVLGKELTIVSHQRLSLT